MSEPGHARELPQITVHQFLNTTSVRTILMPNKSVWFVAADVCEALGTKNVTMALRRLDEDEKIIVSGIEMGLPRGSRGNPQSYNCISESGLYFLTITSRKQEAKAFRRWVTSDVLPTIREQGFYSGEGHASERQQLATMAKLVIEYARELGKLDIERSAASLIDQIQESEFMSKQGALPGV